MPQDSMSHKLYKNLIGGEWVASRTGKTFLNINPANSDDIVGEFQSSSAADIDDAVAAAAEAWKTGASPPLPSAPKSSTRPASSSPSARSSTPAT